MVASFKLREMQIKSTQRFHSHLSGWERYRILLTHWWQGSGETDPFIPRRVNKYSSRGEQWWHSSKGWLHISLALRIPNPDIYLTIVTQEGISFRKGLLGDFPGGPMVKTSPSSAGGVGSIPDWRAKILHTWRPKKSKPKTEPLL